MNEDDQIAEAAKALGLGELLPEVYRDMLQPAARKLGEGLATVAEAVKIALAPLDAGIWGYEQIRQWLSLRVTQIHADRGTTDIAPPPLSIAGPLVLHLVFAKDEPDLKELYASLLASAMDPSNSVAHPAFVTIIQQLTSDEARILRYLASREEKWTCLTSSIADRGKKEPSIERQFSDWCQEAGVTCVQKSDAYLDNLVRLRVLSRVLGNEATYEPAGHNRYGTYGASVANATYEIVEVTAFGWLFLEACIEEPQPNTWFQADGQKPPAD